MSLSMRVPATASTIQGCVRGAAAWRRVVLRGILAAALIGLPGCGALQKVMPHRKRSPRATRAPQAMLIGTISLVNEASRFVLIDGGDQPTPPVGAMLKSYEGVVESGELLATNVRRRPFIIADIKQGTPRKGNRVMLPPAGSENTGEMRVARAVAVEPEAPVPVKKRSWWKLWGR
jgi:hypothetical protein